MWKVIEKAFFPLIFAIALDGFQLLTSVAFAGAGIAGSTIPIFGVAIAPLGIILGFIVNACLSLTFGVGLIGFLGLEGMFYPLAITSFLFGEIVPVFDDLPLWTGLVLWCAFKKLREQPGAAGAAANVAGAILTPSPGSVIGAVRAVDGIRRSANDNSLYAEAA